MKYSEEAKSLLERYLWDIERRLPYSRRKDIVKELKSNLLDMLEERSGEGDITGETVISVLSETGSPEHIAKGYSQDQVLISRGLYPIFKLVFSIVAVVVISMFFVNLFISLRSGSPVNILGSIGSLFGSLTGALGSLVAVFYLIQRFIPSWQLEQEEDTWDPENMPKLEYQKSPGIADSVFSIVFSLVFIVILTRFRDRLGVCSTAGDLCIFFPVLGPSFLALIPVLVIRWLLEIGFHSVMLWKRAWSESLRIAEICLSIADIAILSLFLRGAPDDFIRFDLMEQSDRLAAVAPVLRWVYSGIIILILVITVLETAGKVKGLFIKPVSKIEL